MSSGGSVVKCTRSVSSRLEGSVGRAMATVAVLKRVIRNP